ncbi:MAG: glycoside hydrolase family 2 [Burkholderiales bacterium]|nr:glycoside hydrolase family 2 [Phycisphaerae bacterium]
MVAIGSVGCAASSKADNETARQYLSGKGIDDAVQWDFFCTAGHRSGEWATIPVPSCWDAKGFGTLAYGRPPRGETAPNEQGKYRHKFNVPPKWKDRALMLVFEGSMTDTQAWVNGQSAGPVHQGSFYRFKYDISKLVKYGEENLLEVTVDKESANASINGAERRADYWNFGGIFRPVYLEARPSQHVDRVAIDARADGQFSMDVYATGTADADIVEAQIIDSTGKPVGERFSQKLWNGQAKLSTTVASPQQWTAETPQLYHVAVSLVRGQQTLHRLQQRFGFRTIELRAGDGVYVNGQRVILKGTNRHTFWPTEGRASSEAMSRLDIALMKEMNNNSVRMSHYPPDEHFLDLCDEMGLYVLDELAGWSKSYDTPTGQRLIEQMVTRDVNHPSILFWDNGNENGWNTAIDDDFAKWDPQNRKVLHPWAKFRGTDTKHYPPYDMVVERSKGPDVFFPTEFQHALFDGGGGVSLQDYWNVLRTGKASAGGFIWAFVDETMKRPDQNGKMDGAGNQAPDGIVGPYREKEASFYAVKEIWSPIVVTRDSAGEISVENRYDFTNTDQCTFTWQLRKFSGPIEAKTGFTVLAEKQIAAPAIAPHASGALKLDLPSDTRDADALAVRVNDPNGLELWTWVWPITSGTNKRPEQLVGTAPIAAREDADAITVTTGDLSLAFSKQTGYLSSVKTAGKTMSLGNGPRLAVGEAKISGIEHGARDGAYLVNVSYTGNMQSVQWRIHASGWVELSYAYNLIGKYDFFGVGFDLPEQSIKSMKWLGSGPFRVWKNRLEGGALGVWENTYNNTMSGYNQWVYPEFKGFYAGVRWMRLETTDGPITVALDDPSLYVQVLRPEFPDNPKAFSPTTAATRPVSAGSRLSANAWALFPDAGFSILHGIAPMGTKFNIGQQLGPQGQQNVANGEYRGTVRFFFGELPGGGR